MVYNSVYNLILVPNLVALISQKKENVCFFENHFLTCSVRKMELMSLIRNIDTRLLYKSHQIARFVSRLINSFFQMNVYRVARKYH